MYLFQVFDDNLLVSHQIAFCSFILKRQLNHVFDQYKKVMDCWGGSRRGPQKQSEGWSTPSVKKSWGSWGHSGEATTQGKPCCSISIHKGIKQTDRVFLTRLWSIMAGGNIFDYCLIQNTHHKGKDFGMYLGFNTLRKFKTYILRKSVSHGANPVSSGNTFTNRLFII